MAALLGEALQRPGPTVIRYPRGAPRAPSPQPAGRTGGEPKGNIAFWAAGDWLWKAEAAAAALGGVAVHARYIKPHDAALLDEQRRLGMKIVSIENGAAAGGLGELLGADLRFGWPDEFIPHGKPEELERKYGLDVDSIIACCKAKYKSQTAG